MNPSHANRAVPALGDSKKLKDETSLKTEQVRAVSMDQWDVDQPIPLEITARGYRILRLWRLTRHLKLRRPRHWRN
jgi:hypothetical protein